MEYEGIINMSDPKMTEPKHREYTWKLCALCHGVAHDPDPEGWRKSCDNCAGHGGKWEAINGE